MTETCSVYVRLLPKFSGQVTLSREVAPGVHLDYNIDGELSGVEVLDAWTVEIDGHDAIEKAKRAWWWPTSQLSGRWQPLLLGGDEFGNRTIGIRLPGGMLIVALNIPLRRELLDPTAEG